MPALFVGHGNPMNAIELNRYSQAWRDAAKSLPRRPDAVLVVSAHWYGPGVAVTAMERPRTIHDFYGFPPELYAVRYPAPGSPHLAARVRELLAPVEVRLDDGWGFDHGAWSVLTHVFPDADVPVVALSLDASRPASFHWELGEKLAPLRDENVLVLASGNVVHNLRQIDFGADGGFDWAVAFDERMHRALDTGDRQALVRYEREPDARLSVPTPDHYLPVLYAAALRRPGDAVTTIVEGMEAGSLSMRSIRIG
jgi:4,5-DOPA dioxygenase extradiol